MKKILLLFLLLLITQITHAQISGGVKGGINFSNINDENIDYNSKTGFYLGGFVNIKFAKQFAFQPEILFSMQGAVKENFETNSLMGNQIISVNYFDVDNKLYYINIPLLIKYYFLGKLNFEFGPQIGFAVKNEVQAKSEEFGTQIGEPDTNIDMGIDIGLEYQFYKGLSIDARYNKGLTNIGKDSDWGNKNSVISFGVSYLFN